MCCIHVRTSNCFIYYYVSPFLSTHSKITLVKGILNPLVLQQALLDIQNCPRLATIKWKIDILKRLEKKSKDPAGLSLPFNTKSSDKLTVKAGNILQSNNLYYHKMFQPFGLLQLKATRKVLKNFNAYNPFEHVCQINKLLTYFDYFYYLEQTNVAYFEIHVLKTNLVSSDAQQQKCYRMA